MYTCQGVWLSDLWMARVLHVCEVKFILLERNKYTETNVCDNGNFQMLAKHFLCI